jgi:hypothetical protein
LQEFDAAFGLHSRLAERRYRTDLLHQAKSIPDRRLATDLAVFQMENADHVTAR